MSHMSKKQLGKKQSKTGKSRMMLLSAMFALCFDLSLLLSEYIINFATYV